MHKHITHVELRDTKPTRRKHTYSSNDNLYQTNELSEHEEQNASAQKQNKIKAKAKREYLVCMCSVTNTKFSLLGAQLKSELADGVIVGYAGYILSVCLIKNGYIS